MEHVIRRLTLLVLLMLLVAPIAASQAEACPRSGGKMPGNYTLSAAYPNPFQHVTSFTLTVGQGQDVTVDVYNVLGQKVRTLFHGYVGADDTRTLTFQAEDLPSGIYLYRAQGETFVTTRRVVLVQ